MGGVKVFPAGAQGLEVCIIFLGRHGFCFVFVCCL
jgi:hypothetical protein